MHVVTIRERDLTLPNLAKPKYLRLRWVTYRGTGKIPPLPQLIACKSSRVSMRLLTRNPGHEFIHMLPMRWGTISTTTMTSNPMTTS